MSGFLNLSWQNLLRHRTRSILTMLGMAASVGVLFSVLSFNQGFNQGLETELERTGLHFMIVPSGCAHEVASLVLHGAVIPKFLDTKVMQHVRSTSGISLATPILVAQLPDPQRGKIDLIYGVDMAALSAIKPGWQIDGKTPTQENEVLLGYEVAQHEKLQPGDTLRTTEDGRTLIVGGIVNLTGSQDDAFVYLPIETAQALLDHPSAATAIGVKVDDPSKMVEIIESLSAAVPGIQIVTMGEVMNSISNLAASAKALSLSIVLIAILISAVGVMNSILMAVFERTQEIGMMRAVGASRFDIFRIILEETTIIALVGGLIGIFLSVLGSRLIETFVRSVVPYVPSGELISFDPKIAAGSVLFIFIIGIAAGVYPAWKAAKINPIEAIKG
ncbi:putative ABC transport system permease protein [Malonomonas rubra DSM 5091]|uniref:Putative ABC transport system permease protein n=1 Tax=Malonomonas rubra DSM 5091 TaxID=1122189 RepID=A0A1M6GHX5_MALRU|nr:FtsX-like permease family protein [Malonomonas rubra]SHJ09557.1 putative ABC transport system permease protein [Malonomonas rubra DSM 5091]